MQITKEGIERIKASNPLEAVVAERGLRLSKKGRVLVASCPFHEEKTPSFTVTPSKGLYHCFGCGAAGDVIGFVTKHDQVTFSDALESLARRAGLDLTQLMAEGRPSTHTPAPPTPPRLPPSALLTRVVDHYHRTFCERRDAQDYLASRGLTDPDHWFYRDLF